MIINKKEHFIMRFIMYYSSSDTSDMQIRIFLGNFLRYRVIR